MLDCITQWMPRSALEQGGRAAGSSGGAASFAGSATRGRGAGPPIAMQPHTVALLATCGILAAVLVLVVLVGRRYAATARRRRGFGWASALAAGTGAGAEAARLLAAQTLPLWYGGADVDWSASADVHRNDGAGASTGTGTSTDTEDVVQSCDESTCDAGPQRVCTRHASGAPLVGVVPAPGPVPAPEHTVDWCRCRCTADYDVMHGVTLGHIY